MNAMLSYLKSCPWGTAVGLLLAENLLIFVLALLVGNGLTRRFSARRIADAPDALGSFELGISTVTMLLNTLVTVAGLWLYRAGYVRVRSDVGPRAWLDVLVLLVAMDLAMYVLHRVAHVALLFPVLHSMHHRFERPRPLTLFVLNPLETLAFGALWLAVTVVYPSSWLGMSVYLALNVAFGTLGYLGVEPFPTAWVRWPVARHVGTSTFHAQHHAVPGTNFGFYTLVWDRLFGTLHPDYDRRFGQSVTPAK